MLFTLQLSGKALHLPCTSLASHGWWTRSHVQWAWRPERQGGRQGCGKRCHVECGSFETFPAEDGSILLHRNGARSDAQLLEPAFLTQLLSFENQKLLNRPAKGLSMLAGSIIHGAVTLQRSVQSMVRADRAALLKKYLKQKAHGWSDHVAKILALAYPTLESHKENLVPEISEVPAEEALDDAEAVEESDEEVDMSSLAQLGI